MEVRTATIKDAEPIRQLLEQLGYFTKTSLLEEQIIELVENKAHRVLICEDAGEVTGFCAVHFLPQLGFDGGLVIITFFSAKNEMAAKALEAHIVHLGYDRLCERIQVHCADFRTTDHKFYKEQGYVEYPVYLTKRLIYAE